MQKTIHIKIDNKEVESSFYNDIYTTLIINNDIKITFLTIPQNLRELALGYLFNINLNEIKDIRIKDSEIFIDTTLTNKEVVHRLEIKDIINTCEQITLNSKSIKASHITMPFNASRSKMPIATLRQYEEFFNNDDIYRVKILLNDISHSYALESSDTNAKNSLYKAIGDSRKSLESLYDCAILLNYKLDMEVLKILILQKATFIACVSLPSFSIIKYAQKFGVTLIAFDKSVFKILTHSSRIS